MSRFYHNRTPFYVARDGELLLFTVYGAFRLLDTIIATHFSTVKYARTESADTPS